MTDFRLARRAAVRVLVLSALAVAGVANAAPVSPTRTTELFLGLFVNGDLSQGREYNDAMRDYLHGKNALDLDAYEKTRTDLRKQLADRLVNALPPNVRARQEKPARDMMAAFASTMSRSRCRVTGETRAPNPGRDGQSIATVTYACDVANVGPGVKRVEAAVQPAPGKSEQQRRAAFDTMFADMARAMNDAPVDLPMTGSIELFGSDDTAWTSPYAGDMYQAVSDSIFKSVRMPRMERGDE
ncbi:hypothetical protein WJ58_16015 [Burkholderia ubonensis]|uniref:hypothetical protein n=1 Tax=Burkholderia ubonensis TaxID=101571 RepID=UPI0007589D90|nr:hypothetical protein [Burkholderia ubonensis]KVM56324.1 hypothetical protein WJ58_16015 [Burkholderia ubonensis]